MKWLSHKFWIWVWRKLDSHRLIEEMSTPFEFTIEHGTSLPLSPEDKAMHEAAIDNLLDDLVDRTYLDKIEKPMAQAKEQQEAQEAHSDEMMGRILKGYDKH